MNEATGTNRVSRAADQEWEIEPLLLRAGVAARLLSTSRSQLYLLTSRKIIPAISLGGTLRWVRSDLEDFIRRQSEQSRVAH